MTKPKTHKPRGIVYSKKRRAKPAKLFHFTQEEEEMIAKAIQLSITFMESFGQGRNPYMIDLRHYRN